MTYRPMRGLWIDDSPRVVTTDAFWEEFRELGFTTAAVMLESTGVGFDPKFSRSHLEEIGERCRRADVELVLTVWPEPRSPYLAQMADLLPSLLEASGAAALEFDAESNWTRRRVQGFVDLEHAADALVAVLRRFRELDVRSELTTFTMHGENSRRAVLADDVDRILPQAYSVRNRRGADGERITIPWKGHDYSPGAMQRLTLERALRVPQKDGRPRLSCGLAAYDQRWPGHRIEAMRVAYDAALEYEPVEVRWWSSKWVLGARRQAYAAHFFRGLKT